ncbi:Piso0_001805 [Millerozyma farinosa CBS 7064]|uniref:Piso0_001805 protein n=1 Tax=Pichia sorbitophila (strain ATCC MYA-4447 / BCRC 22081 / CBS 7064 / NBRC 10061 / NRRL Y-12695) TaxID=559304 RepID=G8YLS4_PICSO|nr:Piso0_001805 [Millerozyma farinosa CBS 7064]
MVSYIRAPVYKSVKSIAGINLPVLKAYIPNFVLWGGAVGAGIATFTDGVPLFKDTFYSKIPVVGTHWTHNPDPEDVPI